MLPEDLMIAYQNFSLLASKYGMTFAGMMIGTNPPSLTGIGNVSEVGHDFATLLRKYADIIEEKTDKGQVATPVFRNPN